MPKNVENAILNMPKEKVGRVHLRKVLREWVCMLGQLSQHYAIENIKECCPR
jgi:hypothetical protein